MEEFLTTILNKLHKKIDFDCGNESLNNYIKKQAKQDVNRDLSICYVFSNKITNEIIGYYTISSNSIKREIFPNELQDKLPMGYLDLPAILLGRLAVDKIFKGQKLGEALLFDALKRCVLISKNLGVIAIIVDPIDELAIQFYKKYGFIELSNKKMFISIKTIKDLF